jgi:4'-phosphopantetheinyl transferase
MMRQQDRGNFRGETLQNAIHIWRAELDVEAGVIKELYRVLSADELDRAARFVFEPDRAAFVAARGILRHILAGYLGFEPALLGFHYNDYGKPALAAGLSGGLTFNLSHSRGIAAVAVAHRRAVGIDVEAYAPDRADAAVARNYFSRREAARFCALPLDQQARGFFNCWTRKEAYIKARGMGLSIPLDSFEVSLTPDEPAALLRTDPPGDSNDWRIQELDLGANYISALCAFGVGWTYQIFRWSWPDSGRSP